MRKWNRLLIILLLTVFCGCSTARVPEVTQQPQNETDNFQQEFSLLIEDSSLCLGPQTEEFPWETTLQQANCIFYHNDGFTCFKILCEDGTIIEGINPDSIESTENATIMEISIATPVYSTYRSVRVGMTVEEVLALYPEAEYKEYYDYAPGEAAYSFTTPDTGFHQIFFWFVDNKLCQIILADGMDGYLY